MKQLFFTLALTLTLGAVLAQVPQTINYQAVARNAQGQALASQAIKVRLSIISSASGNPTLYSETRAVTTNALGLFNVQIGSTGALSTTGSFSSINWVSNTVSKSLKVELDINNSGSFTDMGTQSLVTVPFAFAADQAVNTAGIAGKPVDVAVPEENSILKYSAGKWVPLPPANVYPVGEEISSITIAPSNLAFQFVGNGTTITLKTGQTLTVMLSAVLGSTGTATGVSISPVFVKQGNTAVVSFFPDTYSTHLVVAQRTLFTTVGALKIVASGGSQTAGTLDAGTYRIGLGVRNVSPQAINQNTTIAGTIIVQ